MRNFSTYFLLIILFSCNRKNNIKEINKLKNPYINKVYKEVMYEDKNLVIVGYSENQIRFKVDTVVISDGIYNYFYACDSLYYKNDTLVFRSYPDGVADKEGLYKNIYFKIVKEEAILNFSMNNEYLKNRGVKNSNYISFSELDSIMVPNPNYDEEFDNLSKAYTPYYFSLKNENSMNKEEVRKYRDSLRKINIL